LSRGAAVAFSRRAVAAFTASLKAAGDRLRSFSQADCAGGSSSIYKPACLRSSAAVVATCEDLVTIVPVWQYDWQIVFDKSWRSDRRVSPRG
jgi:uncharacterized protein YbjT (DUF2867 family)